MPYMDGMGKGESKDFMFVLVCLSENLHDF